MMKDYQSQGHQTFYRGQRNPFDQFDGQGGSQSFMARRLEMQGTPAG